MNFHLQENGLIRKGCDLPFTLVLSLQYSWRMLLHKLPPLESCHDGHSGLATADDTTENTENMANAQKKAIPEVNTRKRDVSRM